MKLLRLDMNNHLDSLLMTVLTLLLYVANKYVIPSIIDIPIMPIILKIVNDGFVGVLVMVSAVSTALLNLHKFWLLWKERRNKKSIHKNKTA